MRKFSQVKKILNFFLSSHCNASKMFLEIIPWRYKFNSINRIRVDKLSFFTRTSFRFLREIIRMDFCSYHIVIDLDLFFPTFTITNQSDSVKGCGFSVHIVLVFASKNIHLYIWVHTQRNNKTASKLYCVCNGKQTKKCMQRTR